MKERTAPSKFTLWAFLLPSLVLYVFVVIVPIFTAVYYSTFEWPGGQKMTPIGIQNYLELLGDSRFWNSFGNNIYLTVFCLVGQIGFAFLFASLLNTKIVRAKGFHRVVSYFPVTLSAVVVGFVWSMIYDYNFGVLNSILKLLGRADLIKVWLSDQATIMTVVSIPLIWQFIGMYLVIILAAMTSISTEVFEMAELDGANGFQRAVFITLPLVKNTLIICAMLCIAGNMKTFDHIYTMTRGGPGYASSVMAMYSYNVSFMQMNMGYGTTLSIGILVLSTTVVATTRAILTRASRGGAIE